MLKDKILSLPTLPFESARSMSKDQIASLSYLGLPYRLIYPDSYTHVIRDLDLIEQFHQILHYRREYLSVLSNLYETFAYLPYHPIPIAVGDRGTIIYVPKMQLIAVNSLCDIYSTVWIPPVPDDIHVPSYCPFGHTWLHKVIAFTFVPNPDYSVYKTVNHISTLKRQNWSWNLEWTTQQENVKYSLVHQKKVPSSTFKEETKRKIIYMILAGCTVEQIGIAIGYMGKYENLLGVVSGVQQGRLWKSLSTEMGVTELLKNQGGITMRRNLSPEEQQRLTLWKEERRYSGNEIYGKVY